LVIKQKRVAVVTGGTDPIGQAIVSALSEKGYRTVALGRRNGDILADLTSEATTREAATEVLKKYERVDVFVHAAGGIDLMSLQEFNIERWRALLAVNVESAIWFAQAFTPGMIERSFGRIIMIGSDSLWEPPRGDFLPYVASRGAMLGIVRTLAVELGVHRIAVTAVAPGLTDTPMARSVVTDDYFNATVATQAITRRLVPEDTASAVAFLASEGSEAMTGQVLVVNGGTTMR
jgi:NAD(P)-dependent dehydrogenase (short-subunit alcohol dehydrogenase family)